jgi:hypothetical protein
MDCKALLSSSEISSGLFLIVAGIAAQTIGLHNILSVALAPFGIGLILSDLLGRAGKAARERIIIETRKDD